MGGEGLGRLPLWIVVPLVLLVAVGWAASSLPETQCGGEETKEGLDGTIVACFVLFSTVAAVGAGLWRVVSMSIHDQYDSRDGWIFLAALLVLVAAALVGAGTGSVGAGLAIGGLAVPAIALLALVAAAAAGKRVEAVGILLPIYLFGIAYIYLAVGAVGFLASSGIGC
ncbi:MAG TPA: hypothetical protein VFZ29_04625 [Solirubrobacterales bacterium]